MGKLVEETGSMGYCSRDVNLNLEILPLDQMNYSSSYKINLCILKNRMCSDLDFLNYCK